MNRAFAEYDDLGKSIYNGSVLLKHLKPLLNKTDWQKDVEILLKSQNMSEIAVKDCIGKIKGYNKMLIITKIVTILWNIKEKLNLTGDYKKLQRISELVSDIK